MKFIKINLLILLIFSIIGCSKVYVYEENNLVALGSARFPTYKIDAPIYEDIEFKLAEGTRGTKHLTNITFLKKGNFFKMSMLLSEYCDIKYKNTKFYINNTLDVTGSASTSDKTEHMKIKSTSIHARNGREIDTEITSDIHMEGKEINDMSREVSKAVQQQISSIGKVIKSGSIFQEIPNPLSNLIPGYTDNLTTPEIVKGWGTYKNQKVIVTEYAFEDKIGNKNNFMNIKIKGYKLYDAKSFILLSGQGFGYMSFFNSKEGTEIIKFDVESDTDFYNVDNIIGSQSLY